MPPGYTQQKGDGVVLVLVPTAPERTPYLYGFAGRHLSTGNLETDAEAALLKMVVPGWRRISDNHYAMRGTSAAGWFHSLRPSGWTSDGGQALTRALMGTWRFTAGNAGMHQLTFRAGGRYERDLGSSVQTGVSERSSATATGGRFTLRDGELTLTPNTVAESGPVPGPGDDESLRSGGSKPSPCSTAG